MVLQLLYQMILQLFLRSHCQRTRGSTSTIFNEIKCISIKIVIKMLIFSTTFSPFPYTLNVVHILRIIIYDLVTPFRDSHPILSHIDDIPLNSWLLILKVLTAILNLRLVEFKLRLSNKPLLLDSKIYDCPIARKNFELSLQIKKSPTNRNGNTTAINLLNFTTTHF